MSPTRYSSKCSLAVLAGLLLLTGGLLVAAEAQENTIAPFPAKALKATSVVNGALSCSGQLVANDYSVNDGQANYTLTLKPNQSVMAMLRGKNVGWMKLNFTDTHHKWLTVRKVTRVGDKLFLINRMHEDMSIIAVVSGRHSMTKEPYELVICDIDTDLALDKAPAAPVKAVATKAEPTPAA
jgi:hypothetical protein